jgi:hypothetical protein
MSNDYLTGCVVVDKMLFSLMTFQRYCGYLQCSLICKCSLSLNYLAISLNLAFS